METSGGICVNLQGTKGRQAMLIVPIKSIEYHKKPQNYDIKNLNIEDFDMDLVHGLRSSALGLHGLPFNGKSIAS
jgi:hypothetical protein